MEPSPRKWQQWWALLEYVVCCGLFKESRFGQMESFTMCDCLASSEKVHRSQVGISANVRAYSVLVATSPLQRSQAWTNAAQPVSLVCARQLGMWPLQNSSAACLQIAFPPFSASVALPCAFDWLLMLRKCL